METAPKPYVLIELNRLKQLTNIEKEFQNNHSNKRDNEKAENSEGYGLPNKKSAKKTEFGLENLLQEQSENIAEKNYPNQILDNNEDSNVVTKNKLKETAYFPKPLDSVSKEVDNLQKEIYDPYSKLNKNEKEKAEKLLNKIKNNLPMNIFTYNDNGNISLNSEFLANTDLSDILKYLYKPNNSKNIRGLKEFKVFLKNYKLDKPYNNETSRKNNIPKTKYEETPIITYFKLNVNE